MSKLFRVISIVVLVALIFGVGFMAGSNYTGLSVFAQSGNQPAGADKLFEPFWQAWNILHQKFCDVPCDKPLSDDALMQGAISGMVDSLGDSHTIYMEPAIFANTNSDLGGQFQ